MAINKSKIVNKNIEHEKKFVQKKFERETKERQEKKESFIKTEEERIATIKKMLAHDEKATICCLIESLSGLELPFTFEGSLVIEKDSALLLYVTLPTKKIIPLYLREKKKKKREKLVDEHYLEVLSRLFVLLINILYNTIPWLDLVKIKGSDSKESEKKEQMLIALTRNDFRVIDFSLDNPFIQLHNVPTVKCELNIDKRININALMKKEDKSGIIPEIEIGE